MKTGRIASLLMCAILLALAPVALRADSFAYISGTDTVYAWDVTTNTTSVLFSTGLSLDSLIFNGQGNIVWDSYGSNILGLYNTTTQTITTEEPFGRGPADMALEPGGNTILVANAGSDFISRADGATLADLQDITIGARPDGLAYDDNGDLFAVLGLSEVAQLDPTTGAILNVIGGLSEADGLTYDSSTGMLYVGSDAGGFYTVNTALTSAVPTLGLGITTDGIASSGNFIYMINRGAGGVQYNLSDQSMLVSPHIEGADDIAPVAGLGSQQTTPEPGSLMLLATGMLGILRIRRKRA